MMTVAACYVSFGLGSYLTCCVFRCDDCKEATFKQLLKGLLLGVFLSPLALLVLWKDIHQ